MIRTGRSSVNESVDINAVKRLLGITKDNEIVSNFKYDDNLGKLKKDLKALGMKKVGITSAGYGFRDNLYAYDNTNPHNSKFILEVNPLKNDGEYEIKFSRLEMNESANNSLFYTEEELAPGDTANTYKDDAKKFGITIKKLSGRKVRLIGSKNALLKYYNDFLGVEIRDPEEIIFPLNESTDDTEYQEFLKNCQTNQTFKKAAAIAKKYGYQAAPLCYVEISKRGKKYIHFNVMSTERSYRPQIFFGANPGKEYKFEIQTTSYGALTLDEHTKFIKGVTDAHNMVAELSKLDLTTLYETPMDE